MLIPVEEMLHVNKNPPALRHQVFHGVANHRLVFIQGGLQRIFHVQHIGFSHDGDHGSPRVKECLHLGIISYRHTRLTRRTKCHQFGVLQLELGLGALEELGVLRHGTGPAAFDESHPVAI